MRGGELKALIIEDSPEVVEAVTLCLQLRWPEGIILTAVEGTNGVQKLQSESFDLVILDLNLPDIDGFEVLKEIRTFSNVPIIILTVRGQEEDQAQGLEMGADDYIVKPFRPRDLVARVNAVLRRADVSKVATKEPSIVRGRLSLKLTNNEVQIGERTAKLTPNECKILYLLMNNAEQTCGMRELTQEVWGKEYTSSDLIRTYVRRIRNKLQDKPPQIILNQRGGGYRFVSPK